MTITNEPWKKLYERQGPMGKNQDDGSGPWHYCQYGNSNCLDSYCPCTPNMFYRMSYLMARGVKNPWRYLLVLVTSPLGWVIGVGLGLLVWLS